MRIPGFCIRFAIFLLMNLAYLPVKLNNFSQGTRIGITKKNAPPIQNALSADAVSLGSYLRCVNTEIDIVTTVAYHRKLKFGSKNRSSLRTGWSIVRASALQRDPFESYQQLFHQYLFGPKVDEGIESESPTPETTTVEILSGKKRKTKDRMAHFPDGQVMRSELFNNKSGVHFPPQEFIHHGHARLKITSDYMQTAINAFSILLEGTVADVQKLPADYVLKSTRTIAMMKITKEKLAALWDVVKNGRKPVEMKHYELELYRPLFKYVNAREMARLNLKDDKILTYLGTHSELDRHQVGVVASRYIQVNRNWSEVQYLNRMNNLLCGVPMNFMRRISSEVYLQFTHQVFYHIRACDPLQRRFYLAMMTRTEALGKSFSWSARDVSRLGLLLAEVQGPDLASINPEAMSGITAQVMIEMPAHNLQFLTETQLRYLGLKPLNILARKLKSYHDKIRLKSDATTRDFAVFLLLLALPFVL